MAGITIDPRKLIGQAVSDLVKSSIIVGLPSTVNPVPNFIIANITTEQGSGSVTLPAFQITAGDYFMKTAVNSGTFKMTLHISNDSPIPSSWFTAVATALQQIASLSSQVATFGSILPNISGLTGDFVTSQISTLTSMKNGGMPIIILNSYLSLGSLSQTNPFLQSQWYIEDFTVNKEEADGGVTIDVSLTELLTKRDASLSEDNILSNIAGVVTGGLSTPIF